MFVKPFASLSVLTAFCVPHAFAAVVSLYIPDDDGTPYTADPIGTDNSGQTTWRLGFGAASGTFTATTPRNAGPSATLVQGVSDLHIFGGVGAMEGRVDCALATATASDGAVVASCAVLVTDGSTTVIAKAPPTTLALIPVQVSDGNSKPNGAENLRISLGGVAVSALVILGTAGATLVRV